MQANEQLQARLEALRSQPSALVQAQAKQEEHVRDRDKFRTLIDNLQVCPCSVWLPMHSAWAAAYACIHANMIVLACAHCAVFRSLADLHPLFSGQGNITTWCLHMLLTYACAMRAEC